MAPCLATSISTRIRRLPRDCIPHTTPRLLHSSPPRPLIEPSPPGCPTSNNHRRSTLHTALLSLPLPRPTILLRHTTPPPTLVQPPPNGSLQFTATVAQTTGMGLLLAHRFHLPMASRPARPTRPPSLNQSTPPFKLAIRNLQALSLYLVSAHRLLLPHTTGPSFLGDSTLSITPTTATRAKHRIPRRHIPQPRKFLSGPTTPPMITVLSITEIRDRTPKHPQWAHHLRNHSNPRLVFKGTLQMPLFQDDLWTICPRTPGGAQISGMGVAAMIAIRIA